MAGDSRNESYGERFFENLSGSAATSARQVLPIVADYVPDLTKVVDVGCGSGEWLHISAELFDSEVFGIDGPWNQSIAESGIDFFHADFETPLELSERFDLAICLEVAEHLSEPGGRVLVDSLCNMSDAVLFSAAIPHQPGQQHQNCQWPSYWAEQFARNSFTTFDVIRPAVWGRDDVALWYRQNTLLMVRENTSTFLSVQKQASREPGWSGIDVVDPELFTDLIEQKKNEYGDFAAQVATLEHNISHPPSAEFVARICKRFASQSIRSLAERIRRALSASNTRE